MPTNTLISVDIMKEVDGDFTEVQRRPNTAMPRSQIDAEVVKVKQLACKFNEEPTKKKKSESK